MRPLSQTVIALFASPLGVFVLAALDSTLFFSFPLGIDAVVVIMSARMRDAAWIVPLLATAGSTLGAALTFWMGSKIGEKGLDRYVPARRLARIRARIRRSGAIALAVLDLIPPPFPFTPFVLAAGALDVQPRLFFGTLVLCRLLRFGLETVLALRYGKRILVWIDGDLFQNIVAACIALALLLTAVSIVKLARSPRGPYGRIGPAHVEGLRR
jgi:membrane protein YqaA with SNARE-associated domain